MAHTLDYPVNHTGTAYVSGVGMEPAEHTGFRVQFDASGPQCDGWSVYHYTGARTCVVWGATGLSEDDAHKEALSLACTTGP